MKLSEETRIRLKWQLIDLSYVIIAVVLALVVGGIFLFLLGNNPFQAYAILFSKTFSSFGQVLRRTIVYVFTGLAVAIPIRTGILNMGGEGQVAAGAMAAAVIGTLALPGSLHPAACMLAGMLAGGMLAIIPAFYKVRLNSSEVVPAVMLNYIVAYLLQYLTMYTFRGSEYNPQTAEILESARIPRIGQWSVGLFLAIALCVLFAFIMGNTRPGLEMRSAGLNPVAARYQGVRVGQMSVLAIVLGGAMAGLGGSVEVLGGRYLYMEGYFANYGYDGIAVSYMARNNPLGVILTAFLVSALKVGALALDRQTNITIHYATVLQGMIIILLVCPYLVQSVFERIRKCAARRKAAARPAQ